MKLSRATCYLVVLTALGGCEQFAKDPIGVSGRGNEVAEANYRLGVAYLNQGDFARALEKLNKASDADPGFAPTYAALGLLYHRMGQPVEAEQQFKRAINLSPRDGVIQNAYGSFLCQQNRFEEAEQTFLKAAENPLYETPEQALTNAGTCALKYNQTEKAEAYFRRALEKNPKVPIALLQMSQMSYDQGNYLSSRGYLQRYLAVANHTPNSLWLGIRIEQQLGDRDALSSYALLLKNNFPDSEEAKLLQQSGIK